MAHRMRWDESLQKDVDFEVEDILEDNNISFAGFDYGSYLEGEETILKPQLEALGYIWVKFRTTEGDSFGPLMRRVEAFKDGV